MKYAFIRAHQQDHAIRKLCHLLEVHPSGYYRWLSAPHSVQYTENQRLTRLIKQSWLESGCVYGYRKVHDDLRCLGEFCSPNRVWRLMKQAGLKAQVGYKRRPVVWQQKPAAPSSPPSLKPTLFSC